MTGHFDIVIVGAGLSGVCAAYYLQKHCPGKSYTILEARNAIGGTWDLFRYPGIRSDSDMYTLGYSFRPWQHNKAIADGSTIRDYIRETAAAYGIDRKMRFSHTLHTASWSSAQARWTLEIEHGPQHETLQLTCSFLFMCSGYYAYEQGYTPVWPGIEAFAGTLVHPQHWPEALDYTGKQVLVIGSGATAVTMVPAMAQQAAHVTMLQRSPGYIVSLPSADSLANRLHRFLPASLASRIARWKSLLLNLYFYLLARRYPAATKASIIATIRHQLGPDYDVRTHFTPHYNPWDQRLCVAADGDLFQAIKAGKASVVTDQIACFTKTGIMLPSGKELKADIIVTATGLTLKLMGGAQLFVDGRPVDPGQSLSYKGMMYSGIPNLASVFGYTNASWTLKCELITEYVCRLLNYMARHGYCMCTPQRPARPMQEHAALDFSSGYVQRGINVFPRQGDKNPWRIHQNYFRDLFSLRFSKLNDGTLRFRRF